jgi:hypothetical protein
MDFAALLYNPVYRALGVPAVLDMGTDGEANLTVIDKTAGVSLDFGGDVAVNTVKPACVVRTSDLAEQSVDVLALKGNTITFNGGTWRIEGRVMKPGPRGETEGEVYLILTSANG